MTHQFQALGTNWWITIFDEVSTNTHETALNKLKHTAQEFEARYSRFKADSLISKLNQEQVLKVPDEAYRTLLLYGKQLYLRTNTHFNFLTGHLQEAHGYDADYSFSPNKNIEAIPTNPITDLIVNSDEASLTKGKIDIGGFGKGYLIDELASELKETYQLQHFSINGGGDMYVTSNLGDEPLEILLEHPTKVKHFIGKVTLKDEALAASSPFKRIWHTAEQTFSHIIANDELPKLASFVKATTARDADAFATTVLLIDESELLNFAKTETLGIARYNPETNQLWSTENFFARS